MATIPPTKAERDANLDALQEAVDEWSGKEETRLDNESKFLRAVVQGRGASNTGTQNLEKTASLTQSEIDQFIASS